MTNKPVSPALLSGFLQDAQRAQEQLKQAQFSTLSYVRAAKGKRDGKIVQFVEVVDPSQRDEKNQPKVTRVDSLDVVLLNHTMTRSMRYVNAAGKLVSECYSVGPRKGGVGIGTLHQGPMDCVTCQARWPDGWQRDSIEYGSETVARNTVKCNSRYQATAMLSRELWDDPEQPKLAMIFLPMTSVYGVTIKDPADAPERSRTLLSYPGRQDPEGHKGVLLELLTRPWELGIQLGGEAFASSGTPETAIWLHVEAAMLGDSPQPVLAFDIGDELDVETLTVIDGFAKAKGLEMAKEQIATSLRDAYPSLSEARRPALVSAAADGRFGDFADGVRLALPVHAEVMPEPTAAPTRDEPPLAQATRAPSPATGPSAPVQAAIEYEDDEFPPEEDLPFDQAPGRG